MAKCRYCKEAIANEALFCKECNHWQGWYGALLGHLSLGDITVAITLVTLVLATFRSALFGDYAAPRYTTLSCERSEMRVLASNEGHRDGALANVAFTVVGGGTVTAKLTVDDETTEVIRLPQSGTSALVAASMNSGAQPRLFGSVDPTGLECSVLLTAQGFGVRRSPQAQTLGNCSCQDFKE